MISAPDVLLDVRDLVVPVLSPPPPSSHLNEPPGATMTEQQLMRLQGAYYLATGIWPLIHMKSFVAVTGPKRDLWLVRTVGILVSCIGGHFLQSAKNRSSAGDAKSLAISSAAGLAAIDTWYTAKGVISPIYLMDTAVETALIALWSSASRRRTTS
jgi:hypothetical protein